MSIKINDTYYIIYSNEIKVQRNYQFLSNKIHIDNINWSKVTSIKLSMLGMFYNDIYPVNKFVELNINKILKLSPNLTHLNLLSRFGGYCYNNIFIAGNNKKIINCAIINTNITIYKLIESNIDQKNKCFILNNLPLYLEELYIYWNANDWLIYVLLNNFNFPVNLQKIILKMETDSIEYTTKSFINNLHNKLKIPFNCNLQIDIKFYIGKNQ